MPELPHGTVTLLFTDVEGSTRLARLLGVRYDESLAAHRSLLREAFAAHGGVEVDTQGDAFFFAFERAREAVGAAAAAQRALAAHDWPQGEPVRVRMGVHTGEPELSPGGYYVGVDLTRGARICAAAHGGQVVLSRTTRDLVGEDIEVRDLGDYRLKGVPRPERLFQLVAPGLGFDFPPLQAQQLGNLPLPRTPLVGRREEIQQILDALGGTPVLTLTGPGGIGKTRLGVEIARTVVESYSDGAFFVGLAGVDDPDAVPAVIARTLGVTEEPGETAADALVRSLRDRELLLVLDNFERLIAAAPLVADLVAACPRLRVLATSRERLHVTAETEYAVPSLVEDDGTELFLARAARARAARAPEPGPAELDEIRAICRRLDGLPLAIELAAARVRLLPLSEILMRLERRLAFLTGGPRDLPARQQTLMATIDWSYNLLEPDEQTALKYLAVFAGGFSLPAAAALLGDDEAALRLLSSLRDKSLVVPRRGGDGGARFALLDTIREYALERLRADGEDDAAQRRARRASRRRGRDGLRRAPRPGAGALARDGWPTTTRTSTPRSPGHATRELRTCCSACPARCGASGSSAATSARAAAGSARRCSRARPTRRPRSAAPSSGAARSRWRRATSRRATRWRPSGSASSARSGTTPRSPAH